jgi:hypothetical protein
MTAGQVYYIYLDKTTSITVLQKTTTAATSIGKNKILIAVAAPNIDVLSIATFQAFGGRGGTLLTVDNIAANSASVNQFVSNTAQIKDAVITNAKIASLGVDKLIAGTITSQGITLAAPSGNDCYVRAGKTDFDPTLNENGFILGIDVSDSGKAKFLIGNQTEYLYVNGSVFENKLRIMPYTASVGGATLKSTTTTRNVSSTTYTEVKRITVGRRGNYKLFYEILTYMSSPYHGYGQVKLNGSVIATASAAAPNSVSDTITVNNLVPGDVLSLFIKYEAGSDGPVGSRGFDLKVDVADEVYAPFYGASLD